MNTELRNTEIGRQLYNQLRLGLVFPGETIVDSRRRYTPVNKDMWSWEDAMSAPDTATVANLRRYEKTMWFAIGVH